MRDSLIPMGADCEAKSAIGSGYRRPTLRQSLIEQKAQLTQRMADIDAAIAALEANPNVEEVMNTIQKVT